MIHMKFEDLFSLKKKLIKMSSAAVVIGTLGVKIGTSGVKIKLSCLIYPKYSDRETWANSRPDQALSL